MADSPIDSRTATQLKEDREEANRAVAIMQSRGAQARAAFVESLEHVFSHFKDEATPSSPIRRGATGRKTEAQEDRELLEQECGDLAEQQLIRASPAFIKGGTMRSYQLDGLNWLISLFYNGINGILADEMGLGKTLQTISLLGYLKAYHNLAGPHLVIVPNSTLNNWLKEFKRWCPSLDAVILHGAKEERKELMASKIQTGRFEVVVTSYEMVMIEAAHLRKFHWQYMVIDEAHRIKNVNSKLSKVVRSLRSNFRLLVTGTPLQNNMQELWALLNFLMPQLFSSSDKFDQWFSDAVRENNDDVIHRLHMVLKPFLLRRVKSEVETALLPKKEVKLFVGMCPLQSELYKKVLSKDLHTINSGGSSTSLHNIAMQLRKVCNHPYLFDGVEEGPPYIEGEHLVTNCGKLAVLDKLLKKLNQLGSRVLIFSQMTRVLDILEDYLEMRQYPFCRLDGSTPTLEREESIEAYNREGSEKFVFLLSTRAGGLGINLATADTVVLFDSDWNPQMDLQAMDRAHRIGQKKQVVVYRMVTADTIEESILERAEKKLYLDALVIQKGRLVDKHKNASKEELQNMIKFGATAIFNGGYDGTITDKDIDDIIAISEKKTADMKGKLVASDMNLATFSMGAEVRDLYQHEGVDYTGAKDKKEIAGGWIEPPQREAKKLHKAKLKAKKAARLLKKPSKQPKLQPWYFAPKALSQLYAKETAAFLARQSLDIWKEDHADDPTFEAQYTKKKKLLPKELTETEQAKAKKLYDALQFTDWKRDDWNKFKKAMEVHGQDNIAEIVKATGFPRENVEKLHSLFWSSKGEEYIPGYTGLVNRIRAGARKRTQQVEMIQALEEVMKGLELGQPPNLSMPRGTSGWSLAADCWLVRVAYTCGYGDWRAARLLMKTDPSISADWWLLSRDDSELQQRLDVVLKNLSRSKKAKTQPAVHSRPKTKIPRSAPKSRLGTLDDGAKKRSAANLLPPEPTRARTAYNYFQQDFNAKLKASGSDLPFSERSKMSSAKWKEMQDKSAFTRLAAGDKKRFESERDAWEKKTGQKLGKKKNKKKKAPTKSGAAQKRKATNDQKGTSTKKKQQTKLK